MAQELYQGLEDLALSVREPLQCSKSTTMVLERHARDLTSEPRPSTPTACCVSLRRHWVKPGIPEVASLCIM
jgi:hypothetical protein